MKNILSRLGLKAKINKKKPSGFLLISSNSTFYLTFALSLLFHAGLIYTIPAVNVFSDGQDAAPPEAIVVDFIQEDFSEPSADASGPEVNQFRANTPEPSDEEYGEKLLPQRLETESPDLIIAPPEKIASLELENDYVLLSQTVTKEPDITNPVPRKRSARKVLPRMLEPDHPRSDKLTMRQKQLETPRMQSPHEKERPMKIFPIRRHTSEPPDRKEPAPILQFPRSIQETQERQPAAPDRLVKHPPELRKRPTANMQKTTEPAMLSFPGSNSSLSSKRRFGMVRETETDKNRFGIFAGKPFEHSNRKEEAQDPPVQKEEERSPSDVTETAKALQASNEIEGPIRGRAVVHRPRPPQITNVHIDVELKLKFWVLPDGTIGEVIPIKRGNTELEQIAIAYLKKWKFEALPDGADQRQIWGTIPIKFSVQ